MTETRLSQPPSQTDFSSSEETMLKLLELNAQNIHTSEVRKEFPPIADVKSPGDEKSSRDEKSPGDEKSSRDEKSPHDEEKRASARKFAVLGSPQNIFKALLEIAAISNPTEEDINFIRSDQVVNCTTSVGVDNFELVTALLSLLDIIEINHLIGLEQPDWQAIIKGNGKSSGKKPQIGFELMCFSDSKNIKSPEFGKTHQLLLSSMQKTLHKIPCHSSFLQFVTLSNIYLTHLSNLLSRGFIQSPEFILWLNRMCDIPNLSFARLLIACLEDYLSSNRDSTIIVAIVINRALLTSLVIKNDGKYLVKGLLQDSIKKYQAVRNAIFKMLKEDKSVKERDKKILCKIVEGYDRGIPSLKNVELQFTGLLFEPESRPEVTPLFDDEETQLLLLDLKARANDLQAKLDLIELLAKKKDQDAKEDYFYWMFNALEQNADVVIRHLEKNDKLVTDPDIIWRLVRELTSSPIVSAENKIISKRLLAFGARLGDPRSQYQLGLLYMEEKGEENDPIPLFKQIAEGSEWYPLGLDALGICFEFGVRTSKDEKQAFEKYSTAGLDLKFPGALFNLARCYELGKGVAKDQKQANTLYAEGDARGRYMLELLELDSLLATAQEFQPDPFCLQTANEVKAYRDKSIMDRVSIRRFEKDAFDLNADPKKMNELRKIIDKKNKSIILLKKQIDEALQEKQRKERALEKEKEKLAQEKKKIEDQKIEHKVQQQKSFAADLATFKKLVENEEVKDGEDKAKFKEKSISLEKRIEDADQTWKEANAILAKIDELKVGVGPWQDTGPYCLRKQFNDSKINREQLNEFKRLCQKGSEIHTNRQILRDKLADLKSYSDTLKSQIQNIERYKKMLEIDFWRLLKLKFNKGRLLLKWREKKQKDAEDKRRNNKTSSLFPSDYNPKAKGKAGWVYMLEDPKKSRR